MTLNQVVSAILVGSALGMASAVSGAYVMRLVRSLIAWLKVKPQHRVTIRALVIGGPQHGKETIHDLREGDAVCFVHSRTSRPFFKITIREGQRVDLDFITLQASDAMIAEHEVVPDGTLHKLKAPENYGEGWKGS